MEGTGRIACIGRGTEGNDTAAGEGSGDRIE